MKTMKKPCSILLAVILTFAMTVIALPVSALDGTLTVTSSVSSAHVGDTVAVTVSLQNNPGLISLMLSVQYDTTALELEQVEDLGLFSASPSQSTPGFLQGNDLSASPYTVLWSDDLAPQNHTAVGDLVTFRFRVRNTAAAGSTAITVSGSTDNTLDAGLQPVVLNAGSANVLIEALPGDVSGDGEITAADVFFMLQAIQNSLTDAIAAINMDLDGDGDTDMDDLLLLRQYIVDHPNGTTTP